MICKLLSYARENYDNPNKVTSIILDVDGNKLKITLPDNLNTAQNIINYCKDQAQSFANRNYDAIDLDAYIGEEI